MGVAVGVVGGSISIASTVATGVALVAVACIVNSVCYNEWSRGEERRVGEEERVRLRVKYSRA